MTVMIEIQNLVKRFGVFTAVDDVSFTVRKGEVLGFLGPNGAGKSTTMKMVTGFLAPTSGKVDICGHDMLADPLPAKRKIGYLPEGAPAYPDMTPIQLLDFVAAVRGIDGAERRSKLADVADRVNLHSVLDQRIETLSKGFKRRVGLGVAILHDPDVLVMDEPTDGLDPNQKHEVRALIREMARDKAIILSTHILEEVEAVCTRATIIHNGRLVLDGTPAELEALSRRHGAVALTLVSPPDDVARKLGNVTGVSTVESGEDGISWCVFPSDGAQIMPGVSELTRQADWNVAGLTLEHGRLDEVFRDATGGPTGGPATTPAPARPPDSGGPTESAAEPVSTGAGS